MQIRLFVICALLMSGASACGAQSSDDTTAVATTAIKAMMDREDTPRKPIVVDPRIVRSEAAPGYSVGRYHSQAVRSALTPLGARLATPADTINCPKCAAVESGVLLALSDPIVSGDSATVTITAYYVQGPRRRTQYETVHFTLARSGSRWAVVKQVQLGVS
jgi:hypothetical protein